MEVLAIAVLVVVVITFALAVTIVWDRLVGTAFVGVVAGATWMVAQSTGRWWFWPTVIVAIFAVLLALVVAVVIS